MERRPTSHDVAHLAGVSQSTVSFVLTGRSGISVATRDRVLRAAAELHYRPNLAARSMRTQRTGRLAVVVPIATMNPLTLLSGAISAARDAGYVVEVINLPDEEPDRGGRLSDVVDSGQYEGILSFTPLPAVDTEGGPVVLPVGEFDEAMHMTGEFTDARPITEMITHLAAQGHRRFLHLAGAEEFPSARARREAYVETITRLGLHSLGIVANDWSAAAGAAAIAALPDDAPPLAVIAANDLLATGAIRAAVRRGWRLPDEMAVTGWDDHLQSEFLVPSLTSVSQDRERLGAYSMHRLIAAVRGEDPPQKPERLLAVVWRESTESPQS
ncbi:LacI family transcriptional regulator [Microbacterium foliorum]|uniref:HTH-type transcriptional repressor CytR n=1 Tax=Microbacterium foliorum TaxID=104336 RepID=A0A0F0KE77_9MICO|nr:LacI family DNA-binding transcriptional regulator [Microbacterium foliorum]AXL11254.1 LacI family transcriptional regulator [Microbacterium foliorum]KJL19197.1 HTH-type transcriptional repressor CytR [Microbacterium foliorum]